MAKLNAPCYTPAGKVKWPKYQTLSLSQLWLILQGEGGHKSFHSHYIQDETAMLYQSHRGHADFSSIEIILTDIPQRPAFTSGLVCWHLKTAPQPPALFPRSGGQVIQGWQATLAFTRVRRLKQNLWLHAWPSQINASMSFTQQMGLRIRSILPTSSATTALGVIPLPPFLIWSSSLLLKWLTCAPQSFNPKHS